MSLKFKRRSRNRSYLYVRLPRVFGADKTCYPFALVEASRSSRRWFHWTIGRRREEPDVDEREARLLRPTLPTTDSCSVLPNLHLHSTLGRHIIPLFHLGPCCSSRFSSRFYEYLCLVEGCSLEVYRVAQKFSTFLVPHNFLKY